MLEQEWGSLRAKGLELAAETALKAQTARKPERASGLVAMLELEWSLVQAKELAVEQVL